MHYQRVRKTGNPGDDDPTSLRYIVGDWIEANMSHKGRECVFGWPFQKTKKGYPVATYKGKFTTVSRHICVEVYGPPPDDLYEAAHSCGNGHLGCLNPSHIRWATHTENMADKYRHGTVYYGEDAVSKLKESDVREIRKMRRGGMTYKSIANKFGRSVGCIRGVTSGVNWAWLQDM